MDNSEVDAARSRKKLKEEAQNFSDDGEYEAAQSLWFQLFNQQKTSGKKLDFALKIAKCDLDMDKEIDDENMKRISELLQSMKLSGKQIGETAETKEDVESVILWFMASEGFAQEMKPNDRVRNIYICCRQVHNKFNNLRNNPTNYPMMRKLLPLLQKMVKMMREIDGADDDDKAKKVAIGLNMIVFQMNELGNYEDAISVAEAGIDLMKKTFKETTNEHVVAALYNNTAFAHFHLNNFAESVRFFARSILAHKEATDIDEDNRREWIEEGKKYLKLDFKKLKRRKQEKLLEEYPIIHEILEDKESEPALPSNKSLDNENLNQIEDVGNGIQIFPEVKLRNGYNVFMGEIGEGEGKLKVAVKRLEYSNKTQAVKCNNELKQLVTMNSHPNMLEYKNSSSQSYKGSTFSYIAMELCDKNTLNEIISSENPDHPYRLNILRQIANGLSHIHSHGIVHSDLKPPNILRSLDGKNIKIADFGLSRVLEEEKSHITRSYIAGTHGWMAPEVLRSGISSQEGDIFSLGLVFYFTLTGKTLVVTENQKPNLSALSCPDSDLAKDLISKMLEIDRKQRPSISEVQEHAFLWDEKAKLEFCKDFSDTIFKFQDIKVKFSKLRNRFFSGNWKDQLLLTKDELDRCWQDVRNRDVSKNFWVKRANNNEHRKYAGDYLVDLLKFICNEYRHFKENISNPKKPMPFANETQLWEFFSRVFPNLLFVLFSFVRREDVKANTDFSKPLISQKRFKVQSLEYIWTPEKKMLFLILAATEKSLYKKYEQQSEAVFGESWLTKLILTQEEVDNLNKSLLEAGLKFKVQAYHLYNKAVFYDQAQEMNYNEASTLSLVKFILSCKIWFQEDDEQLQRVFASNENQIWLFFLKRFPNLFGKAHESLSESRCYLKICSEISVPVVEGQWKKWLKQITPELYFEEKAKGSRDFIGPIMKSGPSSKFPTDEQQSGVRKRKASSRMTALNVMKENPDSRSETREASIDGKTSDDESAESALEERPHSSRVLIGPVLEKDSESINSLSSSEEEESPSGFIPPPEKMIIRRVDPPKKTLKIIKRN